MNRIIPILFSLIIASSVLAGTSSTVNASEGDQIDRLFTAMNASNMVEQMTGQMNSVFASMQKQLNISADEEFIFDKYNAQLLAVMKTEISWEKMEPHIRQIYIQNFTSSELDGLIKFYESPAGQAFVAKMPIITQESMMMGQRLSMNMMPQIQQIGQQLQIELNEYREQKPINVFPTKNILVVAKIRHRSEESSS